MNTRFKIGRNKTRLLRCDIVLPSCAIRMRYSIRNEFKIIICRPRAGGQMFRGRARAGLRNTRSSSNRPRSCSIAGARRGWRCRPPGPCRAASRRRRGSLPLRPVHPARCAGDRGGHCRRIDRVFEVGRRHELGLAQFARPGARISDGARSPRSTMRKASINSARNISTAAIVCQRCQRSQRRKFSDVGAVVRLQPPDRHQHLARYAVGLFNAREHRTILLHHVGAAREAGGPCGRRIPQNSD